jgi:PAS domain S-box-containing protein
MSAREPAPFTAAFDAVDNGLIVIEEGGRVAGWNAWMTATARMAPESVVGRSLEDIFAPSFSARLSAAIRDALDLGTSAVLTHALHGQVFPLQTRSGGLLMHNVAVSPLAGRPQRCLVQINDVTVATERDRVLRERQNARYDAVVDGAPDAILTLDTKGVIQMANPAAAHEFGYPDAALVGEPAAILFEGQASWAEAWAELLENVPLARPVELQARRKDGSISHVEMSASRWTSDSRVFVTAILRDVNERRTAKDALLKLNQTLEHRVAERTAERDRMWRLSTDIMLAAQLDGRIDAINPAWTHLLGWSEDELLGHALRDFVSAEDEPKLDAILTELRDTRSPRLFEVHMRHRTGAERIVAWSAVTADGVLQAVGRDVTGERESEAALRQAEEALRQSQKMEAIGQLTGGIAHDFNNLLTGIVGSLDMMQRRIAAGRYENVDKFMSLAAASANRAASLTHRLLAFARQQPLDPQPLNVNHLVRDMHDLLRRSLGEQVELNISLRDDLWPAHTDANQLENALLNLAINGRDAMPSGGVLSIETENVTVISGEAGSGQPDPGEYARISVSDTGVGMSPETAAKAFDPFFTTKPIGQGTGLGLSMIYGFAKQSRGHVYIESEVGQGTTVKLYLPRHHGGEVKPTGGRNAADAPRGAGEAILLVEDEPSVRVIIAELLRQLGYSCLEAQDSQTALPILASEVQIDLMVTDVGLPGLNGRQLADIARERRPDLRVLFVTGYARHATEKADFLAPGMDMVSKPFTLDGLASKIRQMIGPAPAD